MDIVIYNSEQIKKTIGERIRSAREKARFSRQALCDILSEKNNEPISIDRLKQWERGANAVPVYFIPSLCAVLGCDAGYLFGEYGCLKREAADVQEETGLSEDAVKSFGKFKLYGDDILALLSSMLVSDDYFYALSNILIAQEWENKPGGAPFIISDANQITLLLPGQWKEICSRGKRDAIAFYMQEAQNLFRKAAEMAIKTAPGDGRAGSGKAGQKASGHLPSQDNTDGR